MKTSLILLLLFLCGTTLFSQTNSKINVSIKGQVTDSLTGETMPYANIKVTEKDKPDIVVKLVAADLNGKFDVKITKPGTYAVMSQYVGKADNIQFLDVTGDEKVIDLGKIGLSDQNGLEEVTVTAFKPLVTVDLDKITYSTEDDPDSKTNTVFEMLRKVPMVTIDAEDKIELKGSGSFKIYLDGKPSNMISNNPTQVLKSMPANTVKNIEVITDPGAKYDAEGVTGIINIVTNKQPFGGYTASVNAGVDTKGGYNAGAYLSAKYNKIGFTGNYNYYSYKSPDNENRYFREDHINPYYKYLTQNGESKYDGHGQYGSGELSYEIDTLNLLSFSISQYGGKGNNEPELKVLMQDADRNDIYSYIQKSNSTYKYGSTNLNADYQRTFKKKDELLTASYRYSISPDDSDSDTKIESLFNYRNRHQKSYSDADTKEHTFQLDYTTPFKKIHTLEAGLKYIIRINESNSLHDTLDLVTNTWIPQPSDNDQFKHTQNIFSGYAGYSLKLKKVGAKVGLRAENTDLKAEFPLNGTQNFDTDYFNLIPSVTASLKYKESHNFRLGYNMRIQRPGIWYLNPYVNSSDPKNIYRGNPDLEVEKSHNINLNYSYFKPKINFNANLYYNFINNSIQQIAEIRNDTSYTTYSNIGKRNDGGLYVYANINPIKTLRININTSASYTDIRANDGSGEGNSGFSGRFFGGIQYSFPHDLMVSLNGGVASGSINLQNKYGGYHYSSIGINKSFLDKKLTFSVNAVNLFEKNITRKYEIDTDKFYTRSENTYPSRTFRFSVTYRFGEMKQQIQKARRGISNDDSKQGEGGSGGSGGGNAQ